MELAAEIRVKADAQSIEKLFSAEEKEFGNKRASYELARTKDGILFRAKAKDSSAMRAVLNSITKMLIVYEKAKGVVKEGVEDG